MAAVAEKKVEKDLAQDKPLVVLPDQQYSKRELHPAQPPAATSLVQALAAAASDPRTDMDKMERLFAMHQSMMRQQAEAEFNGAMARAQAKIQPIATDRENDHTHSRYATLKAINKKIVPIYSAQGLSVTFDTETKNEADPIPAGEIRTVAIVGHSGGFSRRYHIDLPPDEAGSQGKTNKTKVQAKGSTNEYARRYLVRMIFNIATGDDTDGNPVAGDEGDDVHQEAPARTGRLPEYPGKEFLQNLPKWKGLMENGKTADDIIAIAQSKYTLSTGQIQRIRAAAGEGK